MRKYAFSVLSLLVLCSAAVMGVHANTVSVDASISQNVHVVLTFTNLNQTTYEGINSSNVLNKTTIPNLLLSTMVRNGYVEVNYSSPSVSFNNTNLTVVAAFDLAGQNIMNSTLNRGAGVQTFRVSTVWREFDLNVTKDFHFNFTQVLAKPFSQWSSATSGGVTSYSYSQSTSEASFSASFYLPVNATGIVVSPNLVTYNLPYPSSSADNFINSPMLILIALAVIGFIVFVYRRVR